jgi:hypothetical protein
MDDQMSEDLTALVQETMSDLIAIHALKLVRISENEVLLESDSYVIDVFFDKEGANMVYFDTARMPVKGYNIFLFLANKRRDSLLFSRTEPPVSSYAEYIENDLSFLVQHIRNAAGDILSGSKEWIKEYSWPAIDPNRNLMSLIAAKTGQAGGAA